MDKLARYVHLLIRGSCFSTKSTGESYVASSPTATSLEQRVLSVSNVDNDAPGLIALLQRILVYDPLQRMDVTDILKHPWFVGPPHPAAPSGPGSEGIPPLSLVATGKLKPADANQEDPTATLVATSLGLPKNELEPPPLPLESSATTEMDTTTVSLVTRSPPPSIATASGPTITASGDKSPIDPTAATPHETFYFDDGDVEVLCGERGNSFHEERSQGRERTSEESQRDIQRVGEMARVDTEYSQGQGWLKQVLRNPLHLGLAE